jgi:uncharacterized membrane protein YkvI
MKKEGVSTLKVAATYIGTIVGAGFATGQEMLQFFARFGVFGLYGLILTTVLFILFGYLIMELGSRIKADSHMDIIKHAGGKFIGTIIDWIITFFLFGALTAMIAGTGALFQQQFNLSPIIGNVVMAIITALTVLTGINGVINSISIVVPFLLASVLGISIYSIFKSPPDLSQAVVGVEGSGLITNWAIAAILYISYNTVLSIAVLGPLGLQAKNKKTILYGAVLGGLGLGIGSIMIYFAMFGNISQITKLEVPMIYIAGTIAPIIQIVYAVVLIAEVYTTAVGSLFGFVARLTENNKSRNRGRLIILITTILAFFASQFGFTTLVTYLYPMVGYGGIVLLICLIIEKWKSNKVPT